ncbi:S8 family serine peptidase [Permianibacter sp. IMCC34836]|uniref:S8 family serine peptidase n=1 Tax=Permianibacter fluminis TaxID=2738515 RepID=UPI0015582051|nr:S8 family serine peptidase [Permianibacter fluminis]NQD38870.1 S8 family serine peptidase [Permianibacter fluminis]
MKQKFVLSALSAAVLLGSACLHAADKPLRYMILAPKAPATVSGAMKKNAPVAASVADLQRKASSKLAAVGVQSEKQLQKLAPISFADLTTAQVAELTAAGYQVSPVGTKKLLETRVFADTIPYGIAKVRAPDAWPVSTGVGSKVCIIDTGIDLTHPDLVPNFVEGISTVGSGSNDPSDTHGHGTHVAGTIAAAMNGADVVGVAPNASLYIAAVFGAGGTATDEDILEGLDWCLSKNAKIFSMSYGGSSSTPVEEAAYLAAHDAGVLLVAASGNDGPSVPIGYPAHYPFVVAVGATDTNDAIASFSQRGPELDVVAPGVSVLSARRGGGTTTMSGTSMATPHVSGVAAGLLAANPALSNDQLENIIELTATDLGTSGFDNVYGNGRVDLAAALDYAQTGNLPPHAAFTPTVLTSSPLQVLFTDKSTDPNGDAIVSRLWDFGDGTSSTEVKPRHTYPSAGEYSAVLQVTDARGSSSQSTKLVKVGPVANPYLTRGVPVTGLSGAADSVRKFKLKVPANAENLRFTLAGGTGDADLYVRFGAEPTADTFDCRPYLNGNNESCAFSIPTTGVYYVSLVGFTAYSGASLVANYDIAGPTGPSFENTADYPIPDDDPAGVESPINVSRSGPSGTVKVAVNIVHTWIGDLIVDLVSPSGTVFNLHNQSGGSQDNINAIYNIDVGAEESQGVWKLRVSDNAFLDSGYIDSWKITFQN